MHKELVMKQKLEGIFLWVFLLTATIVLGDSLAEINLNSSIVRQVLIILCYSVLAIITIIGIYNYNNKYKYSIIANQFIIHSVRGNNEKILLNIKVNDIVYIGPCCNDIPKINTCSTKRYVCSLFRKKHCCCIYKDKGKYKKIYFQPSNFLIDKIKMDKQKLSA